MNWQASGTLPPRMGKSTRLAIEARKRAIETGELPHEFLLRVSRGELIDHKVLDPLTQELRVVYEAPTLDVRIDAAKAVAPYFAPKLQSVEIIGKTIGSANDDELDAIIADAAAAAGLALGFTGESAEGEDPPRASGRKRLAPELYDHLTGAGPEASAT